MSRPKMTDALNAALEYAQRGWPTFPVHAVVDGRCTCGNPSCKNPGKHPACVRGFKDASPYPDVLGKLFDSRRVNVGLATGAIAGVVVLDVDIRHGGKESLSRLCEQHAPLPATVEGRTGGGGGHYFFAHPGTLVKNSAGSIAPGIDVRGDGGYVVVPPSTHASGRSYEWMSGRAPHEIGLAPLPPWLFELICASKKAVVTLAREPGEKVPEGQRNSTLARIAGAMRRVSLTAEQMIPSLMKVNTDCCDPPLEEDEVARIASSIEAYAPMAKPTFENTVPKFTLRSRSGVVDVE